MSYSFGIKAASKAEAKQQVTAKMQEMVAVQPLHAGDAVPAEAAYHAMIDQLADDADKDVVGSCNGSVSTQDSKVTQCAFSGGFSLSVRIAA